MIFATFDRNPKFSSLNITYLLKGELPFPTIENHGKQSLFFIFPIFKSFLLDDYLSKIHATHVIWKLRICTFRICEKIFLFLNSHRLMVYLRTILSLVEIVKFLPKREISQNFNVKNLNDHEHQENDIISIQEPKRDTFRQKKYFHDSTSKFIILRTFWGYKNF